MAGRLFPVVLLGFLLCGCTEYENTGFVYPNTVTPNGDQVNDIWCVNYIEYSPQDTLLSYILKIYDVNNYELYSAESDAPQVCWTGAGSNFPGTYYFIIDYFTSSDPGNKKTIWGEFKIMI